MDSQTLISQQGKGREWILQSPKSLVHSCSQKREPLNRALGFSGEAWLLPKKKGARGNNQSLSLLTHQALLAIPGQTQVEVRGQKSWRYKVWSSQPPKVHNIIENDQQGSRGAYKEYQTHPPFLCSRYVFFIL